jgi:hypothetical protein
MYVSFQVKHNYNTGENQMYVEVECGISDDETPDAWMLWPDAYVVSKGGK